MSKKELEKEADEYAKKDCPDNFLCTRDIARRAYLAGAEAQIEKMKSDIIECFGSEYNVLVTKLLNKWENK